MGTSSAEYRTLLFHTADLQLAMKAQLILLGAQLVSAQLITTEQFCEIRNPQHPSEKRAADLVQLVQDKVQQNPQCYQTFIDVVKKDQSQYGDILEKLQQTYHAKLQQQHTLAIPAPSGSTGVLCMALTPYSRTSLTSPT